MTMSSEDQPDGAAITRIMRDHEKSLPFDIMNLVVLLFTARYP
jgi:hypothetical protein